MKLFVFNATLCSAKRAIVLLEHEPITPSTIMNLIQKSVLLSASALLLALPDVCAISESEAINKTLWLNTGGHYGNLPGEDQGRLPSEPLRYQYDDSIWDDFDESEYAIGGMNKWLFSIENGILVSNALDDLNDHGEKCGNLSGLYSEFSLRKNSFSSIRPEYLLRFAWAAGSSDSYDDVVFAEISLGFNLRWRACDFFALSAGCRAGVGALIVSKNLEEEGKRGPTRPAVSSSAARRSPSRRLRRLRSEGAHV